MMLTWKYKNPELHLKINYEIIPSPCFVIDEERFRKNLSLIRHIADESGAEIILAFKDLPCGAYLILSGNIYPVQPPVL